MEEHAETATQFHIYVSAQKDLPDSIAKVCDIVAEPNEALRYFWIAAKRGLK